MCSSSVCVCVIVIALLTDICRFLKCINNFMWQIYNYRPQRSWAKVMFLQVCVILFTGGVSASVHAGIPHPPRSRPPGQRAASTHPTGMHSCFLFCLQNKTISSWSHGTHWQHKIHYKKAYIHYEKLHIRQQYNNHDLTRDSFQNDRTC